MCEIILIIHFQRPTVHLRPTVQLLNMMTSSNGNIFRVTGPLRREFTGTGEFPAQRPVPRSFDVFFDLSLNKRLSKQSWGWWSETPPRSLWRQCHEFGNSSFISPHTLLACASLSILGLNATRFCKRGPWLKCISLLWRHNGHDAVFNH